MTHRILLATMLALSNLAIAENLPFDRTNPFIWDNDGEADCRALTLCLALDKLGEMNLIGISIAPHPYQPAGQLENFQDIVNKARATGWQGLPDASTNLGPFYKTALSRPGNGNANDTAPLDTIASRMIKERVLSAGTPAKPVVIGTGGALTTVASAYLLAHREGRGAEFASKCAVYGTLGLNGSSRMDEYNCAQDPWALYVCLTALRTYLLEVDWPNHREDSNNLRPFIDSLPPSPLGDYMKSVHPERFGFSAGSVTDVGPILALYAPNQGHYFLNIAPVSFDFWGSDVADNTRNINCYRQIVHVRGNPSSDDRLIFNYNQGFPNQFALDVFQRAFSGGGGGVGKPQAPTNLRVNN